MSTTKEIDRIFELQQAHHWVVRKSSAAERKAKLVRLRDAIAPLADDIADALHADMRRPRETGTPFELAISLKAIDETLEFLDDWMRPTPVEPTSGPAGSKASLVYEARGVVLLIGPWNFPFNLVFEPLIAALSAGNSVVVKPSEMAPASSRLITRVLRETFDESEVAVIEGGRDVAAALMDKPFDHIFLTGSPTVGKIAMAAAARHLATVTLELGGKNPAFVDDAIDLDFVAQGIATGRFFNNGQACMATDYILLPEGRIDGFVAAMERLVKERYYKDGRFQSGSYGRFIDRRNFDRVSGYLDGAVQRGARILLGGGRDADSLTMEPTIIADVPADCDLMQDEIFGPVMIVVPYRKLEDTFPMVHTHGKPLGLTVFTENEQFMQAVIDNTTSGSVSVNGWALNYFENGLPFGGVNGSGIGSYHGIFGFRALSHERAVFAAPATPV